MLIPEKVERLLRKFRKLRPEVNVIPEFTWAGTFAETPDGLPLIGSMHQWPGCHFLLGFGGNGMTLAVLGAQLIRDQIRSRHHALSEIFTPDR